MKTGDLVRCSWEDTLGIVLARPRISNDCLPGGEGYPNEEYYCVRVLGPFGIEDWFTDDCEVVNARG